MICVPQKIKMLEIEGLKPNPYQIRRNFNAKSLRSLASSIKEVGVLSPIVVRSTSQGYEIVFGERRVRAAHMAGLKTIPAIIVRAGDRECALLSLAENLHRENLSLFEEAEGHFNLISYHKVKKEPLSKKLALENSRINEKIRLLSLAAPIRYKIEENNIDEPTARELLKLHNEEKQAEIIEKIVQGGLNKKQTALLVKNTLREMAFQKGNEKRHKKEGADLPLYINTVRETLQLLKNNGAKAELTQTETDKSIEFSIKIHK